MCFYAGKDVTFDQYKGKVVLVTNVACYCGLTNGNYKVSAGTRYTAEPCSSRLANMKQTRVGYWPAELGF